jgi:GTP-binding protein
MARPKNIIPMPHLQIPQAEFVLSCPHVGLAPKRPLPEIAFAGRSNVGKSSLINSILNHSKLALTSKTPGKTRLLNYFLIGKSLCYFVDLPGYGYAKVSGEMKAQWGDTIEAYLRDSRRLALVVLILDIRHGLTPLDEQMADALNTYNRPWIAVLSKSDKLGAQAKQATLAKWSGELISRGARGVMAYSSLKHLGREDVWAELIAAAEK